MNSTPTQPVAVLSPRKRWLYTILAYFFLVLAIIGALLPIVPTTPFLILASSLFMRVNPKVHARLLRIPGFGAALADWEQHRAVGRRAKWIATAMIAVGMAVAFLRISHSSILIYGLCALASFGLVVVWQLPVKGQNRNVSRTSQSPDSIAANSAL